MSVATVATVKSITIGTNTINYIKETGNGSTIYKITDGNGLEIKTMKQGTTEFAIDSYPKIVNGNTYIGAVITPGSEKVPVTEPGSEKVPETAVPVTEPVNGSPVIEPGSEEPIKGGSKNYKKYKKNNKKSKRKQNKNRNMTFKNSPKN